MMLAYRFLLKLLFFAVLAIVTTSCCGTAAAQSGTVPTAELEAGEPQTDLPREELRIAMYRLDVQIASTSQEREIGLMFRKTMAPYEGMLFIFEQPSMQCFWMKNTLLPLTAAFVADDGTIVNLVDMDPLTTNSHCSKKPVRYVLEMGQGWFAKRGIVAGTKIAGSMFMSRSKK
jgi:uncharacterized membrane protein (UPF0127 family)